MAKDPTEGSVAARERAAAMIGRTLSDRYRIVEVIAMGGMGAVYRAEHLTMRKQIAVKVLHPEVEDFPELAARFEREAVAGAHIQHPNVATASDFGEFDEGSRFLVLEHVDGVTLSEVIDRGPLEPLRAAAIARQTAAALAAVHEKGILHRDIKPLNIMLVSGESRGAGPANDFVKLIDFGFAKVPVEDLSALAQDADAGSSALTRAGTVVGTKGYLAPEAALGTGAITARSDLYALGVVFYQMLSGKPPFEGGSAAEVFAQHRTTPVPRIADRSPGVVVPGPIEAVVRRLLEKDPESRYPDAAALVDALDEAIEEVDSEAEPAAPVAPSPATRTERSPTRRSWSGLAGLVGGGLLLGIGLIAVYELWRSSRERPAPVASTADPSAVVSAPSPSATTSASAKPQPRALERLRQLNDAGQPTAAFDLLRTLIRDEPKAFSERAMQNEAATTIAAASLAGLQTEDAVTTLSQQLGTDGIDILYDIMVRERAAVPIPGGGIAQPSAAGAQARQLLSKEEVRQRGTPAMRIAYDLVMTPCLERPELFERAAKEGDDRTLEILRALQLPACTSAGGCCFPKNAELQRAIVDVQSRLRR
jgi:serine/threonine-protein kinase